MKKFYQSIIAMLLIGFCNFGLYAEIVCKSTLELTLHNVIGTVNISPADIIVGDIPNDLTIDITSFSCADLGNEIEVTASGTENGVIASCFSLITVIDVTPPVAVSDLNVEITIPSGFSSFVLNPQVIDDGSYDLCGDVSFSVTPSEVFCEDIGKVIDVTLNVTDEYENTNIAISTVHVLGELSSTFSCPEELELTLVNDFFVSTDFIYIENDRCFSKSLELFDDQDNLILGNIIKQDQVGRTVTAVLTRTSDDATCETNIHVKESTCDAFYVCDTECNDAPLGDCNSGHSNEDYVEWPCDLTISENYPGFEGTTPEMLKSNYNISPENAEPVIIEGECHSTGSNFVDQIFYFEDKVKIVRTWNIIEWSTFYFAEYIQILIFNSGDPESVWNICDTESNSSPAGDCGSGHSLTDDIEWPNDVASIDARISPNHLLYVSQVDLEDTRPIFVNNADLYKLTYSDQIIQTNADYFLVSRTWTVSSSTNAGQHADYVQNINVAISDDESDLVTVSTPLGRPMPSVIINDVYETNNSGRAIVADEGELELVYEDNPRQGVDINDLVLMYDHILGKVVLNKYQLLASDFSQDDIVSTLDHVLLQKYILGVGSQEVMGWDFVEESNGSEVKGNYIGFKYGDLDDSSILNYIEEDLDEKSLVFKDVLVNAGEEYTIDVRALEAVDFVGAQLIYDIPESVSILDVSFPNTTEGFQWFMDENANLRIIYFKESELESIGQDEVLFSVKFSSSENGVGADIFTLYNEELSIFVSEERENIIIKEEVENEITSGNKDVEIIEYLTVKPNPAVNYITIEVEKTLDYQINVFNANGQKQLTSDATKIDISTLGSGMYFIQGINDSKQFSSKFIKL